MRPYDERRDRLHLGQQPPPDRDRGLGVLGPPADDQLDGVVETDGDGAVVYLHVQPRSGRSQLVGRHGTTLKVRVAAPPVDGRANDATTRLLATALAVPASRVVLVSGAHSRLKRVRIAGLSAAEVTLRLQACLASTSGRTGP